MATERQMFFSVLVFTKGKYSAHKLRCRRQRDIMKGVEAIVKSLKLKKDSYEIRVNKSTKTITYCIIY